MEEVFVGPFYIMFGDTVDTWSGGEYDTAEEAIEFAKEALEDGSATGYQVLDNNGEIVDEYYLEDEETW
jgi:hypothetical protein